MNVAHRIIIAVVRSLSTPYSIHFKNTMFMRSQTHIILLLLLVVLVLVLVALFNNYENIALNKFDVEAHLEQNSQRRLGSVTGPKSKTLLRGSESKKVKVSLVTTFSVKPVGGVATEAHRLETKAAILANVHNEHFDKVVGFSRWGVRRSQLSSVFGRVERIRC